MDEVLLFNRQAYLSKCCSGAPSGSPREWELSKIA